MGSLFMYSTRTPYGCFVSEMNCFAIRELLLSQRELKNLVFHELQTFGLRCGSYLYEITTLCSIIFRFIRNSRLSVTLERNAVER